MLHQHHVVAHCQHLEEELHEERGRFLDQQHTLLEQLEGFTDKITTYRFRLPEESSSSRIGVLNEEVRL